LLTNNKMTTQTNMTDDEMWTIIESVDWSRDRSVIRCRRFVNANYGIDIMDKLYTFILKLESQFYRKFSDASNLLEIGDDSFGDLMSDIIGHGKAFFESIDSMDKVLDFFKEKGAEESFKYVFFEFEE
jgi:hypothetical protein